MKRISASLLLVLCALAAQAQLLGDPHLAERSDLVPELAPFFHGVASGDPLAEQVMIWTRVTPDSGSIESIPVYWQIATDMEFENIVNYGQTQALAANDYTLKVDVCGLQPGTWYYYMFHAMGSNSIIGRTKTAPVGPTAQARFAVMSCADYENGYFNAYKDMADRNEFDAIIHLGDYYYEYEVGGLTSTVAGRENVPPWEIISLDDYRIRHSHYKLDENLRYVHQLYPFITVWDDHETANNSWRDGADNHDASEGPWELRKVSSAVAYNEWMPIRMPDTDDSIKIYRKLEYGDLLALLMLDTRIIGRDEQLGLFSSAVNDTSRHLLGNPQLNWLKQELLDTTSQWKLLGQQVMMAPLEIFGLPFNMDQWDGYAAERSKLYNHILNNNVENVVVLTGDIHTAWANDLPGSGYNSSTGAGSVGVEFVASSITTQNSPFPVPEALIQLFNPHMKYIKLDEHGYISLTVTGNRTQADWVYVDAIDDPSYGTFTDASWYVNSGERHLRSAAAPVSSGPVAPVPPALPDQSIAMVMLPDTLFSELDMNSFTGQCIKPGFPTCPQLNLLVQDSTNHGYINIVNDSCVSYFPYPLYCGGDTATVIFCNGIRCDTTYLYYWVEGVFNQTVKYDTLDSYHEILSDCAVNDEIMLADTAFIAQQPMHGSVGIVSLGDSCIVYEADSGFSGWDTLMYVACDLGTITKCDTTIWIIYVKPEYQTQVFQYTISPDSILYSCIGFDELLAHPASVSMLGPTHGSSSTINDTCFNYIPNLGFIGSDSTWLIGCSNDVPPKCDTVLLIIHVEEPNSIQPNNNLVVFGLYPNPFQQELLMQYYLMQPEELVLNMYNLAGEQVMHNSYQLAAGLHYLRIDTDGLPAAEYILRLQTAGDHYQQKVIKLGK